MIFYGLRQIGGDTNIRIQMYNWGVILYDVVIVNT